jgi:hypothetical protein
VLLRLGNLGPLRNGVWPLLWNTDRMTERPDDSPRRVVKKVVKKTVVRPVAPSSPHGAGSTVGRPAATPVTSAAPRRGAARLTTPARAQASRSVAPTQSTAPATNFSRGATPTSTPTRQPTAPRRRLPRPDVRRHVRDALAGVRDRIEDAWDWLLSLRLPLLSPVRGSAIAGVLVGVLSVAIGWGFYELFRVTLGTQAGGAWGFLAFVFLSFVAFIIGELLLAGFGVPHPRVVSILSVLLVLLLVLVFFIDLAAGVWAWLLIPVLTGLAFVVSSAVMAVAAKEQNAQRLPWEPVDESQVKRD